MQSKKYLYDIAFLACVNSNLLIVSLCTSSCEFAHCCVIFPFSVSQQGWLGPHLDKALHGNQQTITNFWLTCSPFLLNVLMNLLVFTDFLFQIPQTGWDKLFLSFIPAETGKATAKTNKANVRNGNCKWSDPIYEATRLLQDVRTKKYDDKLYKLIVAMVLLFLTQPVYCLVESFVPIKDLASN